MPARGSLPGLIASYAFATSLLLSGSPVAAEIYNEFDYCIRYNGTISAELDLAHAQPDRNYNGTIRCPSSWTFPPDIGAVLTLCPPQDVGSDWNTVESGAAIDVTFEFRAESGMLDHPLDFVRLKSLLVTNGSVEGPFQNDGTPAILEPVDTDNTEDPPAPSWTIEGTSAALLDYPSGDWIESERNGAFFSCNNFNRSTLTQYCGFSQDTDQEGCWVSTQFVWNMEARLRYTIRFDNFQSEVEISSEQEWLDQSQTPTGSYSKSRITWNGFRILTNGESGSVVDELDDLNLIVLEADEAGMPVFVNNTVSQESYSAGNGTFSESTNIGGRHRSVTTLALVVACVATLVSSV